MHQSSKPDGHVVAPVVSVPDSVTSRPLRLGASALLVLGIALPWLNPFAPGPSPAVVQGLFTWLGLALVLSVTQLRHYKPDLARLVAVAWLLAALLSSAMGLLQYFGLSEPASPWINATTLGQAYANLRQRNQFGTLTNLGLLALLYLAARRPAPSAGEALSLAAAAVLLSLGNAASSSRTGLMQLVFVVGLGLIWRVWRQAGPRWVLLTAVTGYAVGALILPWASGVDPLSQGILGRFNANMPACTSRLTLWANVLSLIGQKPWWGWGWGELDFAHFTTLYQGARFCDILDNAHNLPLHLAVELGIPVAALSIALAVFLVKKGRPWVERDAGRQMAWGALAVILLHSMLEYPLWYGPFQMAFGLGLFVLWRRPAAVLAADGGSGSSPARRRVVLAVACLLVAAVAYVAWDYTRISQIYVPPEERMAGYQDNTLEKIRGSRLFHDQVVFAELTTTPLSRDNAEQVHAMALEMLHFSPESRVVEKLIESATLLGRKEEAVYFLARFRTAFPQDYARWSADLRARSAGATPAAD